MDAKVSKDVLEAYVRCSYKAYPLLGGKREQPPPYTALREVRRTTLHDQVATKLHAELGGDVREGVTVTPATLAKGIAVFLRLGSRENNSIYAWMASSVCLVSPRLAHLPRWI